MIKLVYNGNHGSVYEWLSSSFFKNLAVKTLSWSHVIGAQLRSKHFAQKAKSQQVGRKCYWYIAIFSDATTPFVAHNKLLWHEMWSTKMRINKTKNDRNQSGNNLTNRLMNGRVSPLMIIRLWLYPDVINFHMHIASISNSSTKKDCFLIRSENYGFMPLL